MSVLLCWCVDILLITFLELDNIEPFSFDNHLIMGGGGGRKIFETDNLFSPLTPWSMVG